MNFQRKRIAAAAVLIFMLAVLVSLQPDMVAAQLEPTPSAGGQWAKVVAGGFGDSTSKHAMALEVFNGWLYATVSNGSTASLWRSADGLRWTRLSGGPGELGAQKEIHDLHVFNGWLYAGTAWSTDVGAQVWRTADGLNWQQVTDADLIAIDLTPLWMVPVFATHQGRLFVSTYERVLVSETGGSDDWDVSLPRARDGIWSLGVFNDQLYAGGINDLHPQEGDNDAGVVLYRFLDDERGWEVVNTPGFGNTKNTETGGFAVFNGKLYAGTRNDAAGGELWSSPDGTTWTREVSGGFGEPANIKIEALRVYGGRLYAVANNYTTGLQVWSSADGSTWRRERDSRGEPGLVSLTHWNNGFTTFQNRLYLGTRNHITGGEIWSFPWNFTRLPAVIR